MAIKHAFTSGKADAADATLVRPSNWNDAHTVDAISLTEDKLWTAAKQPVRLVATTNQASLSGNLTIDGSTTAAGDVVLLTAQTTASQNGPWIARAGAWQRPTWFPNAGVFSLVEKEQHTFIVWDGTAYACTMWRSSLNAGTTYTIGTDSLTYSLVTVGGLYFKVKGRIIGDFSDTATPSNRIFFQSNNAANANTLIGCLPAGTGSTTALHLYGNSDPDAVQGYGRISFTSGDLRLVGNIVGAGTYPSISIVTAANVRMSVNNLGDVIFGNNSTFPSYSANSNTMSMFLGNDATIVWSTDTGAGKEIDITQNAYLDAGSWKWRETDTASQIRMVSGSIRFRYQASGTAGTAMGAWTTGVMMSNAGRLLVGSTTDDGTNALQVAGAAIISSSLQIGSTPIGSAQYSVTDATNYTIAIGNPGAGVGNGYIGGTTGTTALRLRANGTDMVVVNASSATFAPLSDNAYTCGASGARWSAVWAATGTIQTSDARQKTDVQISPLGLDFIKALRPVSYKWVVGSNKVTRNTNLGDDDPRAVVVTPVPGTRTHYGLLAQEVKAALPEGVDFAGYVKADVNDPNSDEGLRYSQFIAPLIKAVQELSAKCDDLQAQVDALRKGKP